MRVFILVAGVFSAICVHCFADSNMDSVAKIRVAADNSFAGGDMKTAISLLSKLIELEPTNERNFYKRFRAYLSERKYSHALSDLTSSLDLNPTYKQGILQRGKLLLMLGQCNEATKDFQNFVALYPDQTEGSEQLNKSQECAARIDEAERAHSRGDYQSAYNSLTQVLEGSAISSVPLLLERAQLSVSLNNPFDAIADLGTILKLDSSNLIALQMRGEVLYSLGDKRSLEAAQSHYRQGLHSDPEHRGIKSLYRRLKKVLKYVYRAEDAVQRGAHAEAVIEWQEAVKVDPDHSAMNKEFYLQLCTSELHLKQYTAAQTACEKVVTIDDGYALAFAKLSEVQLALELYEDAVRSAKHALELEESNREFKEKVAQAEAALKQSKTKNYYKILGVSRTSDSKEIKKGYRKQALEWHPDKHTDKDEAEREEIEKRFHDIAEAYEILSNDETRGMYDRGEDVTGNSQQQQQRGNPFSNAQFFQQGGRTFHFNFGG
ncbi:dnaj subfamily c member 3 protein [Plasmopara halstedii]|uniref:Dnaj subfamily c member 3 protein n=1 Tax=Plasmopara halstedii TaxID=4781 RepID=A0A0N7L5R3_PLAHL|nr:dnaj subfamily c member 3 protein [Plasmopara halstedii]CEG42195.1 dnaj subfamily c member 3 protein [Plasmopara halstedii]|eukprot:XP_024578564.1 dnaj subfamily c member 3 protein [Plasmopara halstedii]